MYDNIPDWLADRVRSIAINDGPQDRERIYYAAAGWTIAWYLRKDIQATDVDPFFEPPGEVPQIGPDTQWNDHVNRAILVAETLWLLRSSPGFEEQRQRLEKRDLRSAYFEMLAAKQFLKAGYEINARPETGQLGDDFDFSATRGETINVEVTALRAEAFSEQTVLSALRQKATQLPQSGPGVIYVLLPERWLPKVKDWNETLDRLARRFFGNTRRINAVVFWMERHLPAATTPQGRALVLIRQPHFKREPRTAVDISFLRGGTTTEAAMRAITTGEGLADLEDASYSSEFFRWIDNLVPPKTGT